MVRENFHLKLLMDLELFFNALEYHLIMLANQQFYGLVNTDVSVCISDIVIAIVMSAALCQLPGSADGQIRCIQMVELSYKAYLTLPVMFNRYNNRGENVESNKGISHIQIQP
jgi:hypothetical protein